MEPDADPAERMPVADPPTRENHLLRNLDLLVLLAALPVFIVIGSPLIAWVVTAVAWVAGRIGVEVAARKRRRALLASNRNAALGVTAAATMGRVWVLAGAILLVGLLDSREAGLSAALLALVLVTVSVIVGFIVNLGSQGAETGVAR